MTAPRKYPNELRERSQRMVAEAMSEDPGLSLTAAVKRVGPRGGVNARHAAGLDPTVRHRHRPRPGRDDGGCRDGEGVAGRGPRAQARTCR